MLPVKIIGTGFYAPPHVETAAELAPRLGRSENWIVRRTGVERRHVAAEPVEAMAAKAAREALGGGPPPDLLIYAATTPRQIIPDTSVFVARELGFDGIMTFTFHATCLSFMPALQTAAALISTGSVRRALVVSAEIGTRGRNFDEPESAGLLGDGAAAALLEPAPAGEPSGIASLSIATYPEGAELTEVRSGGVNRHPLDPETRREDYFFTMNGPGVYRMARPRLRKHVDAALKQAGLEKPSDIDLVVPHQASGRAIESLGEYLGFPPERVINIIGEYGNCVSASLPMALAHANRTGRLKRGAPLLLIGTGAGLSIGAMVIRW